MEEIGIIQYGVGPIGASIVKVLLEKKGCEILGAVDIDPKKVGKNLDEVIGDDRLSKIPVTDRLGDIMNPCKVKVAVHTTGSYLRDVYPQLKEIVESGYHIISSCEELSYPWREHRDLALELDGRAKDCGVSVLGTGVNPGFLMDTLVITMTGLCQTVSKVECNRVQDASVRRLPFQKKIGAGLRLSEFEDKVDAGLIRHVGFRESTWMIADSLHWKLDKIEETVNPVIAERNVESKFLRVEEGRVAGVDQTAKAFKDGNEVIKLNLQAYLGCKSPREEIRITGFPNLEVVTKGGVQGDIATASVIVNSIPNLIGSEPGLHTMINLPIPTALLGDIKECVR